MSTVRLRDRDTIVTNEGIIFRVLGYAHPPSFYACDAEYAPSALFKSENPKALRTTGDRVFYKFFEDEAWRFLEHGFPQYLVFHEMLGKKIIGVRVKDAAEVRRPERKLPQILEQGCHDELTSAFHDIVDSVTKRSGLSRDDFGVFGSMLHGFYHPKFSDVDLTVYGARELQSLREMLEEFYEEDRSSFANEFESDQAIAGKRWFFQNLSVKEFVWHQRRKLIYALFNDTRSGRVIKTEFEPVRAWEEIREQDSAEKVESCGWVKMIARVVDDSESSFMPSIYGIEPLSVLSGSSLASNAHYIVSFLEEFRLQVFKDEIIHVEGNLEHVEKKSGSHYQVTLTYCPRYYEQTLKTVSSNKL